MDPITYTIGQAAEILKCKEEKILHMGSNNFCKIYVLPSSFSLFYLTLPIIIELGDAPYEFNIKAPWNEDNRLPFDQQMQLAPHCLTKYLDDEIDTDIVLQFQKCNGESLKYFDLYDSQREPVKLKNCELVVGRDSNGEASVAKRNAVSDISTVSCNISGVNDPIVTTIHGELEGKELLAHQTQEGQWSFDELLGATEKQKKAMRNEGFIEPFTGYPHEKVPIGTLITFKDEDVSLIIAATIPGKKEGNVAIKFDHIVKDREPIAILSYSMDISLTTLDENNKEIIMKMALNGGGHMPLSENTKINSVTALSGVVTYIMPSSNIGKVSGPATMKITIKEL
jgi:hypothetical protein